jgi:hypothetical protein
MIANERSTLLRLSAHELTLIDNRLQTSLRAQIHCTCVKHTHEAAFNETLILYTSILSRIWALFCPNLTRVRWCRKTSVFLHALKTLVREHLASLSMIVSRDRCLQAVCNECEFVGHDREQSVHLACNESELKNVMFASRGDDVCKLLQVQL